MRCSGTSTRRPRRTRSGRVEARREVVLDWVGAGTPRAGWEPVRQVLHEQGLCLECHGAGKANPNVLLDTYEHVVRLAQPGRGMTRGALLVSAHNHLFAFAVAALLLGVLTALSGVRRRSSRSLVLAAFAGAAIDVGGWFLTAAYGDPWQKVVVLGGASFGLATTLMALLVFDEAAFGGWFARSACGSRAAARSAMRPERVAVGALGLVAVVAWAGPDDELPAAAAAAPSLAFYAGGVAPWVEEHCAPCHRTGGGDLRLAAEPDPPLDFEGLVAFLDAARPEDSPFVLKPLALANGGLDHAGGTFFDGRRRDVRDRCSTSRRARRRRTSSPRPGSRRRVSGRRPARACCSTAATRTTATARTSWCIAGPCTRRRRGRGRRCRTRAVRGRASRRTWRARTWCACA